VTTVPASGLSPEDQKRLSEVDAMAAKGVAGVPQLIDALSDPSWAVRRGVVAALARVGAPAVQPLCDTIRDRRDDEARLAAAVDALVASRGQVEDTLAPLAEHPDPHVIADVAQVLGRRRSEVSVPLLTRLTTHEDDNVSVAAIEALGRIGGRAAVESLIATVQSGNFFRTFPAIDVLGRSRDPKAVEPLAALLDNPFYAPEAARALGRTGQLSAVPHLTGQLQRAPDAVVRAAAVGIAEIHEVTARQFASAAAVELSLRAGTSRQGPIRRLAQAVAGASADEQRALCRVLAWIGAEEASSSLLALLDAVPSAAAEALQAVGHEVDEQILVALRSGDSARRLLLLPLIIGRSSAAREAIACLDDPEPAVRVSACDVLTRLGDPSAVPALFQHLGESDLGVSQAVVSAIQSLGSEDTERLALEASRSPDPLVRRAALRVIAYFGWPSGLPSLREALSSGDDRLRDAALAGLPYIDDPGALDLLLEHVSDPSPRTRAGVMRSLGLATPTPAVLAALRGGLADPDPWIAYYACQALGKQRDVDSAEAIVRLVDHPSGQVRVAAVEALAHLPTSSAREALRRAAQSADADVQRAALVGLGIAKQEDALPILIDAAGSGERATRLIALSALADQDSPEVLPALLQAATDPDESIRQAAIARIAEWNGPGATHVLVGLLGNPVTRERALDALALPALGRIPGILTALEVAEGELPALLVSALARMNRPDARAAILSALEMSSTAARRAAAEALGVLALRDGAEALSRAAQQDPDAEVRRLAAFALSR
jgi:HEAT repeat protein